MRVCYNAQRIRIRGNQCLYCGQPAESDDHFPPVVFTGPAGLGFLLPSCNECNGIVGAKHPTDLWSRCDLAKASIRKKYRHFLLVPEWSDDEIKEMGPSFRKGLSAWKKTHEQVKKRIAWSAEWYFSTIVEPRDFADYVARINTTLENEPEWCRSLRGCLRET